MFIQFVLQRYYLSFFFQEKKVKLQKILLQNSETTFIKFNTKNKNTAFLILKKKVFKKNKDTPMEFILG